MSLDLNYKLFKPDGSPLRVIAKLRLRESVDPEQRVAEEDAASPDITHQRVFGGSDRFALMTNRIYNDQSFYLDVAAANQLNSFRKIAIGTTDQIPTSKIIEWQHQEPYRHRKYLTSSRMLFLLTARKFQEQ